MRTIEKYLIALYFFISPVEIALHLLVTSSTKYVGLLILLVEACVLVSRSKESAINLSFSSMAIILWIAYCIISLTWVSINEHTYEYITTYVLMSTLLLVTTFELWDSEAIKLFTNSYLLGSLLMAIVSIAFGGGKYLDRETVVIMGRECDPNQVAANILPGIVIFLDYAIKKRKRIINYLGYLGAAFCIYAIFLTGSRGGFVGLSISILSVLIISIRNKRLTVTHVIFAVLISIIGFSLMFKNQNWRVLDFGSYTGTYANGSSRTVIWKKLLESFDISWLWGHGVSGSLNYFQNVVGKPIAVHNTFLLVLYEVGILGFGIYIFSYVNMAYYHRKNAVLFSILVGSLVCSIFLDALNLRYIWNSLILCIMQYNIESSLQNNEINKQYHYKYIK